MENYKELTETIKGAEEYLEKLKHQKLEIQKAESQVQETAEKTLKDIDDVFTSLMIKLNQILMKRKTDLCEQTAKLKYKCLKPLQECQMLIEKKNEEIEEYIQKCKQVSKENVITSEFLNFQMEASKFGCLPAVPTLEEAPFLTFQYILNEFFDEFESQCSKLGTVSMKGPVQISLTVEKPGGLFIEWELVDSDERNIDVQTYRLQYAFGNVKENPHLITNFHDCYIGPNLHYNIRNLQPHQLYTFRVCCQSESQDSWSAWSYPYVSSTSLNFFVWQNSTPHYQVTNDNKLATKISENKAILYSKYAQICPEQSIEFTFLKINKNISQHEGIGLIDPLIQNSPDNLFRPGTLILASTGHVYINGVEKLTHLPKLIEGSKVTFFCEKLSDTKLRVNIDCENKTVTYDWNVCSVEASIKFAVCFEGCNWKILVE